jgi:hypothetical protein
MNGLLEYIVSIFVTLLPRRYRASKTRPTLVTLLRITLSKAANRVMT